MGASLTLLLFVLGVSSLGTRNGFFQRHEALVWHDKVGCICGPRGGIKDRAGLGSTQESEAGSGGERSLVMGILVDMQHEHVEVASCVALPSRNLQRHR